MELVEKVVEAQEDLLLQEQQILVEVVVDLFQVHKEVKQVLMAVQE
jgi:hypothetical protein